MYAYIFVEAIQNQNHHKKDEVNATTSFDNFNEDNWDEEDYYGDDDDDDEIDADTDDYGVLDEENLPDFFGEDDDEEEDDYDDDFTGDSFNF